MLRLTAREYLLILEALAHQYGPGYAAGEVGQLQAKLSILLEAAQRAEASEESDHVQ